MTHIPTHAERIETVFKIRGLAGIVKTLRKEGAASPRFRPDETAPTRSLKAFVRTVPRMLMSKMM